MGNFIVLFSLIIKMCFPQYIWFCEYPACFKTQRTEPSFFKAPFFSFLSWINDDYHILHFFDFFRMYGLFTLEISLGTVHILHNHLAGRSDKCRLYCLYLSGWPALSKKRKKTIWWGSRNSFMLIPKRNLSVWSDWTVKFLSPSKKSIHV